MHLKQLISFPICLKDIETFSFYWAAVSVALPWNITSLFFIMGIFGIYLRRHELLVENQLRILGIGFALWTLLYSLFFTTNIDHSVKGAYDMVRGLCLFPMAYLFIKDIEAKPSLTLYTQVIAWLLLIGNWVIPQPGNFFGYWVNPNNVAVSVWLMLLLAIPIRYSWVKRYRIANAVMWLGLLSSIGLLMLSNSRGQWLGATVAIGLYLALSRIRFRYYWLAGLGVAFSLALFFVNYKGFALDNRSQIWLPLFNVTTEHHPLFGYGINSVQAVLTKLGINQQEDVQTAHNIFLEVYVSTGISGLILFLSWLGYALKFFISKTYRDSLLFFAGLSGLASFFVMGQFDLKLASYRYIGVMAIFFAYLYLAIAQQSPKDTTEHN